MEDFHVTPELLEKVEEGRRDPAAFAEYFLYDPDQAGFGDLVPFRLNAAQRYVLENSDRKETWYCISRRTGKCVAEGSLVLDPKTLKPTPIEQLEHVDKVPVFDFSQNRVVWCSAQWLDSGHKPCVKLSMTSGVKIILSEDHMVFHHRRGWCRADSLHPGDRILAPDKIPAFGDLKPDLQAIENAADFTLDLGEVPLDVWRYDEESLRIFLTVVWRNLGRFTQGESVVVLMTNNRKLALELRHLFLRFGVECFVSDDGCLFVYDEIDVSLFLNTVGVPVPILDVHGPRRWETISETKRVGQRRVFDLSVFHPDTNFVCNDVVVHNSFLMSFVALWKAITVPNLKILYFARSSAMVDAFFSVIDKWLDTNELLGCFKAATGNQKDPQMRRFITGSSLLGVVLGGSPGEKRGLTGDVILVDEAQELKDEDWATVGPIIRGDRYRSDKIKAFVAGTVTTDTENQFYRVIFERLETPRRRVLVMPITENPDYSEEDVLRLREDVVSEEEWMTEYLLTSVAGQNSVFQREDIEACSQEDWDWESGSFEAKGSETVRILSVDWDKLGATGSRITVLDYCRVTGVCRLIYHYEVPKDELHYHYACAAVWQVFQACEPDYICVDAGQGEMPYEHLLKYAWENGLEWFAPNIVKVNLKGVATYPDPNNPEQTIKKPLKPFLVDRLKDKIQQRKMLFPNSFEELKKELENFRIKRRTAATTIFFDKRDHVIATLLFAIYILWEGYENFLVDSGENDTVISIPQTFVEEEERKMLAANNEDELAFWDRMLDVDDFRSWAGERFF